jgi:putative ABC transport system ATP-binding protein
MGGGALLRRALRRHPRRLSAAVVLLSLHQACEALVPVAIGVTIDSAVATGSVPALVAALGSTALLFVVLSQAYRFGARAVVSAWLAETHQLRVEVAARVLDPRGMRSSPATGELLSIATSDAERAGRVLEAAAVAVAATTALTVAGVALLLVDLWLGVGVLLGAPLLVGLLQLLAPVLTRRTGAQQREAGHTAALATDLVRGVRALRGIRAEDVATERFRAASRRTLASTLHAARVTGVYRGASTLGSGLFLAAVVGAAGHQALTGRLTVGELVTVVGLAQFLAEPVGLLGFAGEKAAEARASAARVAGVLAAEPLHPGGGAHPTGPGELELRAVSCGPLAGLSVHVCPGELLGVVPEDPREAETLVAVLGGRLPADEVDGALLVDGVDTRALDPAATRRTVLVEPHTAVLFEGTLRSTVDPAGGAPEEAVLAAARAAAADDIPAGVAGGWAHPVSDGGRNLSGGQRQRMALTRALLRAPTVLVLHDPTTAVDSVTEEAIAAGLAQARAGCTTVLVTTSPALLGRCDRVLALRNGRVAASGTHADLTRDAGYRAAVLR